VTRAWNISSTILRASARRRHTRHGAKQFGTICHETSTRRRRRKAVPVISVHVHERHAVVVTIP
jgi:hypothetical protein